MTRRTAGSIEDPSKHTLCFLDVFVSAAALCTVIRSVFELSSMVHHIHHSQGKCSCRVFRYSEAQGSHHLVQLALDAHIMLPLPRVGNT